MKLRFALPVAMAALFAVGTIPDASAKMVKKHHGHMMAKTTGKQAKVGLKKQSATGGPAGGSTKSATGGGS